MSENIALTPSKLAYRPNITSYHEELEVHEDKAHLSDKGIICILGTLGIADMLGRCNTDYWPPVSDSPSTNNPNVSPAFKST